MTVHVQTMEHGFQSYPHADGFQYDENGFLDIIRDIAGDAEVVGSYPPGHWAGVAIEPEKEAEEIVDTQLVPRVWEALTDVPAGTRVHPELDLRNDIMVFLDGTGWYVGIGEVAERFADGWNIHQNEADEGPFTEVIA